MNKNPGVFRVLGAAALFLVAAVSIGSAAETKGSGTVTYVNISEESVVLANGSTLVRSTDRAVVLADNEDVPFHLSSQDNSGTWVFAEDGTPVAGFGHCDGVDQDGDVWWIWWKGVGDGSEWGFLGGTGKYEGIKGGGTTKTLVRYPDGRFTIRWEGTWTLGE